MVEICGILIDISVGPILSLRKEVDFHSSMGTELGDQLRPGSLNDVPHFLNMEGLSLVGTHDIATGDMNGNLDGIVVPPQQFARAGLFNRLQKSSQPLFG
eukprot:CAMPEP_0197718398 /NCGR_PEP_ID=MMETSP1434-20131217/2572_1 /TAXON_ID=265543 /ORGANISM="Minutocellus polymorphus, Strain CCMP3303" /LENGTH=99 /DNA_ID=CAMNT_0043303047 /DNA_START=372 /DNA_END=671 /DNA_ORIENTATION=+